MNAQDDLDSSFPTASQAAPSKRKSVAPQDDLDAAFPTAAAPIATSSPSASSPHPVSTMGDVVKSTAEGAREGTEGLVGMPGDFGKTASSLSEAHPWINRLLWASPIMKGEAYLADHGYLPTTSDIHGYLNKLGVPEYTPQTKAGEYGKTFGEFIPGALTMGETSAVPLAANVAKYALAPAVASQFAGDQFKGTAAEPYVRAAAGLAGGLGAEGAVQAGRAGLGAAEQFIEPLYKSGRDNWAARTFQSVFSDKNAAKTALEIEKNKQLPGRAMGEIVPGSLATTGQLTGDLGALSAEREMSTRDPAFFKSNPHGTGSEQQNAARTDALQGIQPTGDPEAVGQGVRDRLAQIEAEHNASHSAALKDAQEAATGIGGGSTPEAIGANLRDALQSGRNTAKTNERKLWDAVDPDGTLTMPATPISAIAENVAGAIPKTAKPISGEEAAIFDTAQNLPEVVPFNDITALRSRISTAMREELRASGQTPTYARLGQLRGAVEDAISSAVENKAAIESRAVAKGAMAPEDAMAARLKAETDAFKQTRALAAGDGSGTNAAGFTGSRQARISGSSRAEVQGNGGFGNSPRDQGVPLAPNLDEDAAQRLKIASASTKERAQTYDQGVVGSVLKTKGQAGDYSMIDAAVPGNLFSPGPGGAQTIAAYRKAAGPEGEAFLHDAAAQSLTRAAVKDGVLDFDEYAKWAAKHQDALREFPDTLKAKYSTAAAAGKALDEAAAARKHALDIYQKSQAGKFLGLKNPQDITRTVGSIFGARDGVERMSQLVATLKDNPDAQQGLRKAVADYIIGRATGTTEAGASGVENLNASTFQKLVRDNIQTLKAARFSDEEIGFMRAIGEDMQRSQRTMQATKLPGQSNTMQDLASHIQANRGPANISLLVEMLAGGLTGLPFGLHGSVMGALTGLGENVLRGMRRAGISNASMLVRDAMFNPELALALLEKTPKNVGVFAHTKIGKALRNMAVFSGETPSRDQRPARAAGGAIKRKSHEELVSRLMSLSEKAKAATKRDTKSILNVPDNTVAKALEVAQKAI